MSNISNDRDFQQALHRLDPAQQRALAARFVERVLPLGNDDRVTRAITTAANPAASDAELKAAFHDARAAAIDSHNRCGAECDWTAQAGYFVARAAVAAVSAPEQGGDGPAWSAAINSRMALTCRSIDQPQTGGEGDSESAAQYQILSESISAASEPTP